VYFLHFWNVLQRNCIVLCLQAAELQEKLSKTLEENQKLQEKLLLLSREKQATDKKVMEIQHNQYLCFRNARNCVHL